VTRNFHHVATCRNKKKKKLHKNKRPSWSPILGYVVTQSGQLLALRGRFGGFAQRNRGKAGWLFCDDAYTTSAIQYVSQADIAHAQITYPEPSIRVWLHLNMLELHFDTINK